MTTFSSIRSTWYPIARRLWVQYVLASTVVSLFTYLLAWIVATEIIFRITTANRKIPNVELGAVWNAAGAVWFGSGGATMSMDKQLEATLLAIGCFSVVAVPVVVLVFRGVYWAVAAGTTIGRDSDRSHVAYAWACAGTGLLCVLAETVGVLEFESEDLLIGIGGVNMLVEEIRILEREAREIMLRKESEGS